MIAFVAPYGAEFTVRITHDNQGFRLAYQSTKEECEWMADMFNKALRRHNKEILAKNAKKTKKKAVK